MLAACWKSKALWLCAAFALSCAPGRVAAQQQVVLAEVLRAEEQFAVEISLPRSSGLWAFSLSDGQLDNGRSFRIGAWEIDTPGIRLERVGAFDALVAEGTSVPRLLHLRFRAFFGELRGGFDPALKFSNGAVAIFGGHLRLFPARSREQLASLQWPYVHDLEIRYSGSEVPVIAGFAPPVPLSDIADAYAVFGQVETFATPMATGVLDPGLPAWLKDDLPGFLNSTLQLFRQRLGPHAPRRPTVLAIWQPGSPGSPGGRYVQGMLTDNIMVLRYTGDGFATTANGTLADARHLAAHEAAHLWLGQTVRAAPNQQWITESGADWLASTLLEEALPDISPGSYTRKACADWLEHRWTSIVYQPFPCAPVFQMAVHRAAIATGRTYFDFAALLISRNPDGEVSETEWLDAAAASGLMAEQRNLVATMLADGSADGEAALARLLDR